MTGNIHNGSRNNDLVLGRINSMSVSLNIKRNKTKLLKHVDLSSLMVKEKGSCNWMDDSSSKLFAPPFANCWLHLFYHCCRTIFFNGASGCRQRPTFLPGAPTLTEYQLDKL